MTRPQQFVALLIAMGGGAVFAVVIDANPYLAAAISGGFFALAKGYNLKRKGYL